MQGSRVYCEIIIPRSHQLESSLGLCPFVIELEDRLEHPPELLNKKINITALNTLKHFKPSHFTDFLKSKVPLNQMFSLISLLFLSKVNLRPRAIALTASNQNGGAIAQNPTFY